MFSTSASTSINATPEAVSDFARHPEWAHERLDITVGDKPTQQAGATFESPPSQLRDSSCRVVPRTKRRRPPGLP